MNVSENLSSQTQAAGELVLSVASLNEQGRGLGKLALRVALGVAGTGVGVGLALNSGSYQTNFGGVDTEITARAFDGSGSRIITTFGNVEFPELDVMPVGLQARPSFDPSSLSALKNLSVLKQNVTNDYIRQRLGIAEYFGLRGLAGAAAGGLLSCFAADFILVRGEEDDRRRLNRAIASTALGGLAFTLSAGYGLASLEPNQLKDTRTTGVIALADGLKKTVDGLNNRDTSTQAILGGLSQVDALLAIRDAITVPIEARTNQDTAFSILLISDMHLRNEYPFLQKVIKSNDINLIINTGDETEKGTSYDFKLNSSYLKSLAAITTNTPMIWVKGNHDSDLDTASAMANQPNVYVLDKEVLQADGLWIAGLADPRNYGDGTPALGSAESNFEKAATLKILNDPATAINGSNSFDILMTHEQPAGQVIVDKLKNRVRLMANGHTHEQNNLNDLQQSNDFINLVEGSTGMGGILNNSRVSQQFSVLKVAADCQFVSIERYKLSDISLPLSGDSTYGNNSSVTTFYFKPQSITHNRACGVEQGISSPPQSWTNQIPDSHVASYAVDSPVTKLADRSNAGNPQPHN